MQTKGRLVFVVGLAATFSAGLMGQSIIEYGQGVGRAGAAGAASGTGIAGIFSKVRDTSDDDKTKKRRTTSVQTREELQTNEFERDPGEPANAPLKMKTSSGVVVSGVSPSWMTTAYRDPLDKPVRVEKVEWSNPDEETTAVEQENPIEDPAGAEEATELASETSADGSVAENKEPARVVSGHTFGESGAAEPAARGAADPRESSDAPPQLEAVTDAEIAGVRIGSRIEEVFQTLGRPKFSFTGLTGRSYTEKYVFKTPDGETITVLTWAGVVTSVLLS